MQLFVILAIIVVLLLIWSAFTITALLIHLIPWIIIGLIAGYVASAIVGSKHGFLGDIGLGLLGSVLAGFVMRVFLNIHSTGFIADIIAATIGAIVVLLIGKMLSGGRRARTIY